MEFSLSTLVVGSAIASDATRRIVELYDGELACGQKFLRFSHPGRRCPSFAPPDCAPGERRCQEIFAWPLPAFGRCFYLRIRYVPIDCSFCQVAGYPAAWQYPWHLPPTLSPFGFDRAYRPNASCGPCRAGLSSRSFSEEGSPRGTSGRITRSDVCRRRDQSRI